LPDLALPLNWRQENMDAFLKLATLRDRIESELKKIAPAIKVFRAGCPRVANTPCSPAGAESETQLIALDLAGICVSNGSPVPAARSRLARAQGHGASAMPKPGSSLRLSLGWNSTENDVDYFLQKWAEMYGRIKSRLPSSLQKQGPRRSFSMDDVILFIFSPASVMALFYTGVTNDP